VNSSGNEPPLSSNTIFLGITPGSVDIVISINAILYKKKYAEKTGRLGLIVSQRKGAMKTNHSNGSPTKPIMEMTSLYQYFFGPQKNLPFQKIVFRPGHTSYKNLVTRTSCVGRFDYLTVDHFTYSAIGSWL
jgi:hypothetical protein